ncbi:MAG: aminotransferase class V-fold PLP-dependent enzyme [Planctomycetaceae bacterium]|nr:aminotransferase class V-fold PLP-dependent enzyme [Planctomycetaceae bacterium]
MSDAIQPSSLAIDGGVATVPEGPPRWPGDDPEVLAALEAAYRDGSWGRYDGPNAAALVAVMRELLGIEQVSLCCSGTVAVELALRGLAVTAGDEVILAGYDFPGNFRAITAIGALPVLVDVVAGGVTIDVDQLDAAVSDKTRAIVVSHLHGQLAPMERIMVWARERGIAVVEDACQVPGGSLDGKPLGTWGDAGTFSFGGSKLLTSGRGGAVVTPSAQVQQRIKIHCQQGNHAYPLSELQAAVLVPQWRKLPARHEQRRQGVQRLLQRLHDTGLVQPHETSESQDPAYYKVALWHDPAVLTKRTRDAFVAAVEAEGVAIGAGFRGFAARGASRCRKVGELPHSCFAAERVMLVHHPVLLEAAETIDRVATAIEKVARASR